MISSIRIFQKFNPNIQRGKLKACEICRAKFSVFTPEHQCKRCLRAVCSACAGNKREVYKQGMSKAPHRLCKFCNTQSSILIQFVSTNKLRFAKDSQIGRKWHKMIPKSSAQSSSFKQYKKFNIETFNELWDSYNFSLREFVGLLTFNMEQGSVYMEINNVYTQLQSRGVSQKFQNLILMIVFVLCFSGADVCTDLVEFLCSLKKTVTDQKQILQSYLNTLLISQQQSRKIIDYINYKFKHFVGPLSVNAVTAQCTIHVISKAFEKQRIDEVFMLLAIIIQMNFDMLLKNKGNKTQCDYQILRDCDMSIYVGKFKMLGSVDVSKNKLTLKQALSQKQQNQQNQQTRIIQKPNRKQSNHSAESTPPKPSYLGRANRQTIQQDIVNDEKFNVPASHDSMSQSFVSEGESKRENLHKNNQSFEQGMTKQLNIQNNGKKFLYMENQSPSLTNNILGSLNSQQDVQRTKSSYITLSNFNEDQINLVNSRSTLASQPAKQTTKQAKKQVADLNLSKIMKELGKKKSKNTGNNVTQQISITQLLKNEEQRQKERLNNQKFSADNNSPTIQQQPVQQTQEIQKVLSQSPIQKQPPKIIYNDNFQLNYQNSPQNIQKSKVAQNRGRTPTVNQAQGKDPETRTRTTTVAQSVAPSQSQSKLQGELKQMQKRLQKRQQQLHKSGEMFRSSQAEIQSLRQELNQIKNKYQLLSKQKRQIQTQLSLQKAQKVTNTKKESQQSQNQLKVKIQQQNIHLNKLRQQLQQVTQKNNLLMKQYQKYQLQSASINKQMEELKLSNRLMKDKLQENSLGLGNKNSKRDQNVEELNKINELMQKNLQNKNKQIQSLTKKNKQLSLQLDEYTRVNKNSQIQAQVQAEAEKQQQLAKKLKKQNEMLIKKMQQLGERVVKQQGQKLQISSQLFELKQRQRSYSMVLQQNKEMRASIPNIPQRATINMETNPQAKSNCLIF